MVYDETTVQLLREMIVVALKIAAPMLCAGVAIGLTISILQSVTSIQDQTLTFVPKICTMLIVGAVLIPWIVKRLLEYAADMFLLF